MYLNLRRQMSTYSQGRELTQIQCRYKKKEEVSMEKLADTRILIEELKT